jgi:hypothetical protein
MCPTGAGRPPLGSADVLRRRRAPEDPLGHVDPAAVSPRFSRPVADALDARRRFADVVAGVRDGPVRDRLAGAGGRLDDGVAAVWDIAQRATDVERTLAALDPERVTDEYKRAKRGDAAPELEAALAQRFASVQRLLNALDDTDERLRLLDARLGAAVAGAAEVALGAAGAGGAERLGFELDGVVAELGALRTALDELG